ncbi:MAG: hypothetical protein J7K66_06910 [Anaerolineaceae bacterium]|nr:hypothetical protein [Anaerolineaceae bacterium]
MEYRRWGRTGLHVSMVVTGASRVEQVRQNMKAIGVVEKLTSGVIEAIEAVIV